MPTLRRPGDMSERKKDFMFQKNTSLWITRSETWQASTSLLLLFLLTWLRGISCAVGANYIPLTINAKCPRCRWYTIKTWVWTTLVSLLCVWNIVSVVAFEDERPAMRWRAFATNCYDQVKVKIWKGRADPLERLFVYHLICSGLQFLSLIRAGSSKSDRR